MIKKNFTHCRDAQRVRILRNNNLSYRGVVMTVTREDHPTLQKILEDVTRELSKSIVLPTEICQLRRIDGEKIICVNQLLDAKKMFDEDPDEPVAIACCHYEKFHIQEYEFVTEASRASVYDSQQTQYPSSMDKDMPLARLMPRDFRDSFQAGELLPCGHAGAVLMLRKNHTKQRFVLKVSELKKHKGEANESVFLSALRGNEAIIEIMGSKKTDRAVYTLVEAMDMDLLDYCNSVNRVEENQLEYIVRRVLEGLNFIHSQSVMHRDIKLKNLFIRVNPIDPRKISELKIADFGLACYCSDDMFIEGYSGTPGYLAPEIAFREQYNKLVDCYSAGVVFHILSTDKYPTNFQQIAKPKWDNEKWPLIFDLLQKMLCANPKFRWSAKQLLEHPFLQKKDGTN